MNKYRQNYKPERESLGPISRAVVLLLAVAYAGMFVYGLTLP